MRLCPSYIYYSFSLFNFLFCCKIVFVYFVSFDAVNKIYYTMYLFVENLQNIQPNSTNSDSFFKRNSTIFDLNWTNSH